MSERRAWICEKCAKDGHAIRVFQQPGEPEPRCETHGKMTRQANIQYRKRYQKAAE